MTTPIKVVNKIDDFAVEISIADISFLTKSLLQLQHARYPHLVPMYRTVHRTKPRAMVLRAIRWVNPKRMFPGAGLTREEMQNMSSDELEKLIVNLNDYRGEAHVIHNRYNQMIDLINMGELPYYIPYAGFKQDKWEMLQEYKERALRLKDGTEEWEQVLDRQALEVRNILLKREGDDKRRLDDIEGLWVDAKGNPAAPNFMDVKKGKEKKIALRKNRIMPDGKRVRHAPKVYARRFIGVGKQEIRKGEVVRMPAGGQVRRPGRDFPTARRIFDEHGGAAEHLLRMPRRGWAMGISDARLREQGNMISMPAGRKNPMILTFSELSEDDVANRREARWTQPDPLGKRGVARHRGGASRGAQGSMAQEGPSPHPREPSRPSSLRDIESRIRSAQQRPPSAEAPEESKTIQRKALAINEHFNVAASNLFQKYNVDVSSLAAMQSITEADVASIAAMGGGINGAATLTMTLNDGRKFIYKIVDGEQKSEQLASILDKVLDLNTQVDAVIYNKISIDAIKAKGGPVSNRVIKAMERGGGHLQAFCEPNCREWGNIDEGRQVTLVTDDAFRESYIKMSLLDFIGGNWDRHRKNFMVTSDGKLQGIDNGFLGGYTEVKDGDGIDNVGKGTWMHGGPGGARVRSGLFPSTQGRRMHWNPLSSARRLAGISSTQVRSEAEAVFDRHYDEDKIKSIQQEIGMDNRREGESFEDIKTAFVDFIVKIL